MSSRTCLPVASSMIGAPGIAIRLIPMSSWPGGPTTSQRKSPHLREGHVGLDLHAELLRVEGERLVLIVDPELRAVDFDHATKLVGDQRAVFSKRAVFRPRVQAHDAGRHAGVVGGRGERVAV